ncbi:MAG: hypothetical protein IPI46_08745 [Bacteroidetes bacterium]|nr:hypothetical protein [Bacteroidota bacterium]
MDQNIDTTLASIRTKVKKIKARNAKLESENAELRASIFEYLQQLEIYKQANEKAAQGIRTREIGDLSKTDKKVLRKDLDKYILMIDKCIATMKVKL